MLHRKLDSAFDIDDLYIVWEDTVRYSCYPTNSDISDKYFAVLNEYYANRDRPFSNWNIVHNSLDFFAALPEGKLSGKNKDLLILAIFFSFTHFDASSCTGFEASAYESLDMLERLGLSDDEMKYVFSHISSLDYAFVFDEEKRYSYHALRDSCFFWLDSSANQYLEFASKLKEESKLDDESWTEKRRNILADWLSCESLMHTEGFYYPWSDKLHKTIQNNLLDELNTLPKTGKILSAL